MCVCVCVCVVGGWGGGSGLVVPVILVTHTSPEARCGNRADTAAVTFGSRAQTLSLLSATPLFLRDLLGRKRKGIPPTPSLPPPPPPREKRWGGGGEREREKSSKPLTLLIGLSVYSWLREISRIDLLYLLLLRPRLSGAKLGVGGVQWGGVRGSGGGYLNHLVSSSIYPFFRRCACPGLFSGRCPLNR